MSSARLHVLAQPLSAEHFPVSFSGQILIQKLYLASDEAF